MGTRGPRVNVPQNLSELSTEEQEKIKAEVLNALSYIMIIPAYKNPMMATVADAEALKQQQVFYANAQNGDVLLVFDTSEQAVIYRPSDRKVVNAGSLIID